MPSSLLCILFLLFALPNAHAETASREVPEEKSIKPSSRVSTERLKQQVELPTTRRDKQALLILEQMLATFGKNYTFSFNVSVSEERIFKDGVPLNFVYDYMIDVKGDSNLRLTLPRSSGISFMLFSRGLVTYYDHTRNLYTQGDFDGSIDELFWEMRENFDVSLPGTALLSRHREKFIRRWTDAAIYVGIERMFEGNAHHLAFFSDKVDWQVWVDEKTLLPAYLIITYKLLDGAPQSHLRYNNWQLFPSFPENYFEFSPQEGAVDLGEIQSQRPARSGVYADEDRRF
ncbi:DUF2092 domain-containing protein [Polycladidibacter hongkongensis]|uniref:DUF2092 domain-containing protein n=1 Tax=Polycladidibacter hongkongensis TaxID=1647556 RepID=UPI00083192AF|nr:DUF2092 domain-containing protein [Pseudovibrio hongkongensis]